MHYPRGTRELLSDRDVPSPEDGDRSTGVNICSNISHCIL